MSKIESELNIDELLKIANIGVYKTTPNGKIIYANKYLAEMLGYKNVEELMKRNLEETSYYAPEYPRTKFKEKIEKNGFYKGESCWIAKNGERIYVMEFAIKTEDEKGNVYYEGMVENITPLKEAYNEEKRLKEEWISLFNAVPDSVIILSEDQTILDVNKATLDLLHLSKEEIIGKKCYTVFHKSDHPPEGCPFISMIESNNYSGFNEMVMDTVGGKYLVTVGLYDVVNGEKRIIHFAKDVTQIYDMREKLIASLERYNRLLIMINTLNRLFMKVGDEKKLIDTVCREIGNLEYLEGACIFLLGRNSSIELESMYHCEREILDELAEKTFEDILEFEKNNKKILGFPIVYENEKFGYMGLITSENLKSEEIKLFQTIAYDMGFVIHQIRLEKEKSSVYKELEKNLEDLTVLVDGVRNPLAVIMGIAEVELKPELRKRIVGEIEKIDRVTRRVDKIWRRTEYLRKFLEK